MAKHQLCRNCGYEIDHNYCPACGQRTATDRLTWASLAESASSTFIGDEAYGLRGINMRKGAVMTWLAILVRPYVSVSEFILGHRRKYFNPVAILLMLSTFYAVVFALVGKEFTPTAKEEGQPMILWMICSYYDYAKLHPAANMLLMLPFYALAMKTVFRRRSDLRYVEYLYIGIFLAVFEITLMILALPAELMIPWYSSFYMQTLPVFIYAGFVFWKLFRLKKKGAVVRTLLANILQYVYAFVAGLMLLLTLGGYYMVAPEKFKEELNIGNEKTEGLHKGEGTLNEILDGVMEIIYKDDGDAGTEHDDNTETTDVRPEEEIKERAKASKGAAKGTSREESGPAGKAGETTAGSPGGQAPE